MMSSMERKARILQVLSITILIIALFLYINGAGETVYFASAVIAALGVLLKWAMIDHKIKKQERSKSE